MDDNTFSIWKSELLKELPSFWESLSETRKKQNSKKNNYTIKDFSLKFIIFLLNIKYS